MHRLEVHMSSPQGVTTDDYMVRPSSLGMHTAGTVHLNALVVGFAVV